MSDTVTEAAVLDGIEKGLLIGGAVSRGSGRTDLRGGEPGDRYDAL